MRSPQDCPDDPTLNDLVAGLLAPPDRERLRAHLQHCSPCRARLARLAPSAPTCPEGAPPDSLSPPAGGPPGITPTTPLPRDEEDTPDLPSELTFLRPSDNPESLGRLGEYEVQGVLGRGGMGVVLRAFDVTLNRTVAIKVLAQSLAASPTARQRFLREARSAAGVNHPNVVTIHAVHEQSGMPYLVMEFIPGISLHARIRQGRPFDLPSFLRIASQIAAGLQAAHAHGIVHRDIKPANIMLEDGIERVKITDFGLALTILDVTRLTSVGLAVGTPAYMSPEQVNSRPVGPPSDLFSLGAVLYTMATGRSPFHAAHPIEVGRKVSEYNPPPLHEVAPTVPRFLSDVVARLLAKKPEDRYASAAEVHQVLLGHLARVNLQRTPSGGTPDAPEEPPPTRPLPEPAAPRRVLPLRTTLALAGGLAVILAGVLLLNHLRPPTPPAPSNPPPAGQGAIGVPGPHDPGDIAPLAGEVTVSRTGPAQFRDLREALARVGPGATIRILDAATYTGPLVLNDPERLRGLTLEALAGATVACPDSDKPVVSLTAGLDVTLRGLNIRAGDSQHCLSLKGPCRGVTVEKARLSQPAGCGRATIVLWPHCYGAQDAPIVFRDLDVRCGEVGVAVLGDPNQAAQWVRVENCRFSGPGVHVALETAVRDVAVTGNVFIGGLGGVSFDIAPDRPLKGVRVSNNTFFAQANWLAFTPNSLGPGDLAVTDNLVLETGGIKGPNDGLAAAAPRWFRGNCWEEGAGADPNFVRLVAEPRARVNLLSRDPAHADFLRPAPGALPAPLGDDRPCVGARTPQDP